MGKFDSFKKKMSDVADKATDKAKDVADKAADKAKDMAEIGKLNMALADKRKDLDKAYTQLGKGYFEKEENLENSEAYLEATALTKEINDLQEQIEILKNKLPEEVSDTIDDMSEEVADTITDVQEDLSELTKCIRDDAE